jgi:3-isopropylmalate/(R)-2-methylmalate dehydratase small subunit
MTPFDVVRGVAAPLVRPNIDTDAIIPSREMKRISKTGLADGLFAGWRYTNIGGRDPDPRFVLNDPAYAGASILLAGENFGCGSSREHAVWALSEYGFRAVLAPSFSPIFQTNCLRNGVLAAVVGLPFIEQLVAAITPEPQRRRVTIDLPSQTITGPDGASSAFPIGQDAKTMLLEGLDIIDLTLQQAPRIAAFRAADRARRPWAYLTADDTNPATEARIDRS